MVDVWPSEDTSRSYHDELLFSNKGHGLQDEFLNKITDLVREEAHEVIDFVRLEVGTLPRNMESMGEALGQVKQHFGEITVMNQDIEAIRRR